jgi:hypothetical protein
MAFESLSRSSSSSSLEIYPQSWAEQCIIPLFEFQQKHLLGKILVIITMAILSFLLCVSVVGIPIFIQLHSVYDRLCQGSISDLQAKLRRAHHLIAELNADRNLLARRLEQQADHHDHLHARASSLFDAPAASLERISSALSLMSPQAAVDAPR